MKLGVGAWIGIIGGGLGGLIGMAVAIAASPVFGTIFSVVMIAIFGGVFGTLFRGMAVKNKLIKNGVAATARIVKLNDTGVTINNSPQIKLLLEVTPPNGAAYLVETKEIISRLQTADYQIGQILPVKIDLNNKDLVAIDYSSSTDTSSAYSYGNSDYGNNTGFTANPTSVLTGPWTGMSAAEADKKLHEINDFNTALMSTGEAAKAIVTKYTWLGIYVGESNPAVELELEILPDSGSPFKGKATAVLMVTSVPKYQPGCEIYVAYDRNDKSKVTVTHS